MPGFAHYAAREARASTDPALKGGESGREGDKWGSGPVTDFQRSLVAAAVGYAKQGADGTGETDLTAADLSSLLASLSEADAARLVRRVLDRIK